MNAKGLGVILDLATDTARSTISQLVRSLVEKLADLPHSLEQGDFHDVRDVSVVAVTTADNGNSVHKNVTSLPHGSTVIVSQDPLDLLFKAKTELDKTPGSGCEVQVVTSAAMKKFWEAACLHLFSPVTTWSVWGVVVEGQELTLKEPVDAVQMEGSLRKYLRTVGDLTQVNIWRSDLIPGAQFNAGQLGHAKYFQFPLSLS